MSKMLEDITNAPSMIKAHWLPTESAVEEVRNFKRRFGHQHLMLATHGALQLIVSPELLNLIRINFLDAEEIPWFAEADFLLSPLCHPLGEGLFEVEPSVREVLLVVLEDEFGQQRFEELADFLLYCIEQKFRWKQSPEITRTQQWIAQAYLNPDRIVSEMTQFLEASLAKEEDITTISEQIQVLTALELVAEPLARTSKIIDYQRLTDSSRILAQILYGDEDELRRIVTREELEEGESFFVFPTISKRLQALVPKETKVKMSESENNKVRVFVSHQTTHTPEAQSIVNQLQVFGADRLEFFLAEKDISVGIPWRRHIRDILSDADILLLIIPKTDADWTWPIFEAGLFEGSPRESQNFSRVIILYSPAVDIPKPLEHLQSVKAVEDDVVNFLRQFFGTTEITGIGPPLNRSFANNEPILRQTANSICKLFSEEKANNISCLPHMAIHVENPLEINAESIPENAIIDAEEEALRIFGLTRIHDSDKLTLTWGDFIEHLSQDYNNWLKPLIKVIDSYNTSRRPRKEQITFLTEEDKIYLSSLHRIDYLGDGARRFHIIFTPYVNEGLFLYDVPDKFSTLLTCLILGSRLEWEVCEKFLTRLKAWPREQEQREREKIFVQIREAIGNIEEEARYRQNKLSKTVYDDQLLIVFSKSTDKVNELNNNLKEQQQLKDYLSNLKDNTSENISEENISSALENLKALNRKVMLIVSNEYHSLLQAEK